MPCSAQLLIRVGAVVATTSVVLGGTAAEYAPPAVRAGVAVGRPAAAVPDPDAPHVGLVSGVQPGRPYPVAEPSAVQAFDRIHRTIESAHPAAGPTALAAGPALHVFEGSSFDAGIIGAQATQSVSTDIKPADARTYLYSPTIYPSTQSCIEVTTAYTHDTRSIWAWDWCGSNSAAAQVPIDSSFLQTYTQNQNYSVQIRQTDAASNTWSAYLYDYQLKAWRTFFTQHGQSSSQLTEGWDLLEFYSDIDPAGRSYACSDLTGRRFESQDIQVNVGGQWVPADASNAGQSYDMPPATFDCDSLSYQMLTPYSHWKATGTAPDLVVTSVKWSPAAPVTGGLVTFNATIKNRGAAATPNGVKHTVAFLVDGREVSWSDTDQSSLAPGASIKLTANGGPGGSNRWKATTGAHTVEARVDDARLIAESNENNNAATKYVTVTSAAAAASADVARR